MGFFEERFGAHGFIGEHLWLGHLGYFFLVLSFCAALLACISYWCAEFRKEDADKASWRSLGRIAFGIHGAAILGIFVLLFIMILNHWFEYHYAWHHSSRELPLKYIISSFWEGQEGSFLLWQFWLVVLGLVGIFRLRSWEDPVMGMTALTQVFLGSMVIGINVLGHHIGSNPFVLLRNEMTQAPIFQQHGYLSMIADGNGLNPLLQNYWMTIHPPVLFCGFASALFPFAFVIAALIRNDYTGWIKPALPWTLFNVAVLGTGILMGGAWAYESLSFGGFWAWDPVENMSFVPWLFILAGLHLHLAYKYTRQGIFTTFLFYILGFVMVLYSTFLTRSGILGDTSVHAFTDLGMTGQLVIYLFAFLIPALALLLYRSKDMPSPGKEEELLSREFWMFIGSLVLVFSAVQQIFTTSIPVWNDLLFNWLHLDTLHLKIGSHEFFKDKLAPPADLVGHYNSIQIWLAILGGIGTALIQYFAYTSGRLPGTIRWAWYSLGIAFLCSIGVAYGMHVDYLMEAAPFDIHFKIISPYYLMLLASLYAIIANIAYIATVLKGNIQNWGGTVAHMGFGVFLLGVLLSQHKKEAISLNTAGVNYGKDFNSKEMAENMLMFRDSTYHMGGYEVTYKGFKAAKPNSLYEVHYVRKGPGGSVEEEFSLFPNAQINPKMGMLANPDTKHYWTKDVFTHVSSVPDNSKLKDKTTSYTAGLGDTIYTKKHYIVFTRVNTKPQIPDGYDMTNKIAISAVLEVRSLDGDSFTADPIFVVSKSTNSVSTAEYQNEQMGFRANIHEVNPETRKFTFDITEKELDSDFIIMKAIVFPYIRLVWLGGMITFFGVFMSLYRRYRENKA